MRNNQTAFLENITNGILEKNRVDYSEICLILPTRRSVLYAKEFLIKNSEGAIILPRICSFESFVNESSNIEIIGKDEALMLLHKVFMDIAKKYNFSFSDFLDYSMLLLQDFNQIDQNMVEVNDIYSMLSASESLNRWAAELDSDETISFDESGMMSDYFTFWQICSEVYFGFTKLLLSSAKAYQGLAYRHFAEEFESISEYLKYEKVIFAGFNYLSGSQLKILGLLQKSFHTSFHWDIDQYFLDRKYHEAGRYLRSYDNFGKIGGANLLSNETFPKLQIQSCPNKNAQVKKVVDDILDLLSSLDFENEIKDRKDLIALIPADESLLKIILESFPQHFNDKSGASYDIAPLLNISMGRGLLESQFTSLLHLIFELQEMLSRNPDRIAYRTIRAVFIHPIIKALVTSEKEIDEFDNQVRKDNNAFLNPDQIRINKQDKALSQLVFRDWNKEQLGFIGYCIDLLDFCLEKGKKLSDDERIFLSYFKTLFNRLGPLFNQLPKDLAVKEYKKLLMQLLRQYSIPFSGEPVSPVQIIGLLETRALDFDHTFIISCNEGSLPSKRTQDSLFPFEIKKQFGMPTFLDKDASLSYTFYRLFYRSSTVHLYYHNAGDQMSGRASRSRFLRQLELELFPDFERPIEIKTVIHHFPKNAQNLSSISKNEAILQKIENYLSGEDEEGNVRYGLSPSMLNTYLRSPIEFFQKAVLGIKEADALEEGLAASTFGSIIHEVLEDIFTPYVGQVVDKNLLTVINKKHDLKKDLTNKTRELAGNIETEEGINRLYLHSAGILIKKYLKSLENDEFQLLKLETPLKHQIVFFLESKGKEIKVTLTGKADRIDLKGNAIRIVDYKTGNFSKDYISLSSFDNLWEEDDRDKILQLLIYKYLFIKNRSELFPGFADMEVQPGFYFFRRSKKIFMKLSMGEEMSESEFCLQVESLIKKVVSHMLDSSIPFESELEKAPFQSA